MFKNWVNKFPRWIILENLNFYPYFMFFPSGLSRKILFLKQILYIFLDTELYMLTAQNLIVN